MPPGNSPGRHLYLSRSSYEINLDFTKNILLKTTFGGAIYVPCPETLKPACNFQKYK